MTSTLEYSETDGVTGRRRFRVLQSVLAWGLLLLLALFIWPSNLGGSTTTIIVSGHSMEPTYYTGDIVVARHGEPQVGDVVVYTTAELGNGKIVHRIIGGDGETGWDLQGDNNDFVDPFHPTNDDVLGIAQFRFPALGKVAGILSTPLVWGSMLLVAFGLIIWPSKDCPDEYDDDEDSAGDDSNTHADAGPSINDDGLDDPEGSSVSGAAGRVRE